ncbi:hypothetical protein KIPE111705_20740 [Kibdelosporangium persicum]|uniref:Uncharacterized protein n=1 Tax=Kibdelosporangium persicum TaxID=2698649 RepID=A0ABX2FIF7_9PSEU|nr:hypothetical protein [Kibdelosporangium persicum]NRN71028.1 hypothetical protein [Kibdelosporangium persicum]
MARSRWLRGRDIRGARMIELFVITAVSAVLVVRAYLELTGYPELSGGGLHIAHTLWGTLLMLGGQLVLLSFLGPRAKAAGAVVAGTGFGLVVDEVGKFVTADNNYFFQPTFAIIYAVFCLVIISMRWLADRHDKDPATELANALAIAETGVLDGLTETARAQGARLIADARAHGADELMTDAATRMIEACPPAHPSHRRRAEFMRRLRRLVRTVVRSNAAFVSVCVVLLIMVVDSLTTVLPGLLGTVTATPTVARIVQFGAVVAATVLIVVGFLRWLRDRRDGIRILRYAVLVNILIGQVFNFADRQLAGLPGVVVNLGMLAVLTHQLRQDVGDCGTTRARDRADV